MNKIYNSVYNRLSITRGNIKLYLYNNNNNNNNNNGLTEILNLLLRENSNFRICVDVNIYLVKINKTFNV